MAGRIGLDTSLRGCPLCVADLGVVYFGTQCIWFDGSTVPIARPQHVPGASGHFLYSGSAPIFVTGKLEDVDALEKLSALDPNTGRPASAEASMLHRRLRVYPFSKRIPKPPKTVPCPHCFAEILLSKDPLEIAHNVD